jgi:hypothetical protein
MRKLVLTMCAVAVLTLGVTAVSADEAFDDSPAAQTATPEANVAGTDAILAFTPPAVVPEPAAMTVVALGGLLVALRRRPA